MPPKTANKPLKGKGGDKSNYTKAMLKQSSTNKGAPPELPTPDNKGKPKSCLPRKKIPNGMVQIYKDVPNYALRNRIEY
jgi:hypothetical protein